MKRMCVYMLLTFIAAFQNVIKAQEKQVSITKFEMNPTSRKASMTKVLDNNNDACAVIRFWHTGSDFIIEPNMGELRREEYPGETRLWVPKGTKKVTIKHLDDNPLRGYEIPIPLESTTDYDAEVKIVNVPTNHHVYLGAGYNIMSISGPSLAVGAIFNHHNIELGAVYGLNKTDDLYYYDSQGDVSAGFNYNAIRAQLRYGYEIPVSDFFSITPQVGIAYNAYIGNETTTSRNSNYKNANSLSAFGAMRFTVSISNSFKFCLTPEYDAAVYKDETCKLVSNYDDNMKKWHTGFNLNVGLMVFF